MARPTMSVGRATVRRTVKNTKKPDGRSPWLDAAKINEHGFMEPAEYLVRLLNDERAPRSERMEAAKALLKHMYTTMPAVPLESTTTQVTHENVLDLLDDAETAEMLGPAVVEAEEMTETAHMIGRLQLLNPLDAIEVPT